MIAALEKRFKRAARAAVGVHKSCPVEIILGPDAPKLVGSSYHYTTSTGTLVRFPNAYKRKAKSANLIYCASTMRVVVGSDWKGFAASPDAHSRVAR